MVVSLILARRLQINCPLWWMAVYRILISTTLLSAPRQLHLVNKGVMPTEYFTEGRRHLLVCWNVQPDETVDRILTFDHTLFVIDCAVLTNQAGEMTKEAYKCLPSKKVPISQSRSSFVRRKYSEKLKVLIQMTLPDHHSHGSMHSHPRCRARNVSWPVIWSFTRGIWRLDWWTLLLTGMR